MVHGILTIPRSEMEMEMESCSSGLSIKGFLVDGIDMRIFIYVAVMLGSFGLTIGISPI